MLFQIFIDSDDDNIVYDNDILMMIVFIRHKTSDTSQAD